MEEVLHNSSIFWVEVEKIKPNPYQPRRDFDQAALQSLADSIRQYGVLQPLVVTRREVEREDGGLAVEYELIAGERRLRASRLAGISAVPVVIRRSEDDERLKLELAIIENVQREDLNPIDRARAFMKLHDDFGFKHTEIAGKIGKSREYVANTVRFLNLPEEMMAALSRGEIMEGHAHPLLMLSGREADQLALFKEILERKLIVREAERIARRIATERARKRDDINPDIAELENKLASKLGTRVHIEIKESGGRVHIDFFSRDDLQNIISTLANEEPKENEQANEAGEVKEPVPDDNLYSVTDFTI